MESKINIDIRNNIKPELALRLVARVIDAGKISKGENGKMYYCWLTVFDTPDGEIAVSTQEKRLFHCLEIRKERWNRKLKSIALLALIRARAAESPCLSPATIQRR